MEAGLSKELKFASSVRERLNRLSCPYTQDVDDSWILELIFKPGEPRITLLQWLFIKFNSKLSDILEPQHPFSDTKMDSRVKRLLSVASKLGLCGSDDVDLIRGVKSVSRQKAFIDKLLDMACFADCSETSKSEKFVRSCNLIHKLSQSNVDAMFPSNITLLPPDIARQIELESQKSEPADVDKRMPVETLQEEMAKLDKDLHRQNEILAEICRKHDDFTDVDGLMPKSTMKQTLRLALSEFDQLLTSFAYCYDNELRSWCGCTTAPAVHSTLGPTLKHVHTPLDQLVNLMTGVQSIKDSIRHLRSDLHREISRLRLDVEHFAGSHSTQGSDAKTLSQSLQEAVNILEQSLMREEEQSRCAARLNSSVTSATVKLP